MSDIRYHVTVKKIVREMETDRTSYENTNKKDKDGESIWAYIPKPDKMHDVITTLFEQSVDELDVLAVVAAVNRVTFQ